ncbi:MAG: alpha/beta fold hydrolase [Acidimicrobiales bacterium]
MRRLPSTDGVEVAVYDWAGAGLRDPNAVAGLRDPNAVAGGRPLLFAHATGMCAGVWAPLASRLAPAFGSYGLDLRGHGRSTQPAHGTEGIWRGFTADVRAAVDGLGLDRPVGVGHSSGGAALLMAEADRPGTFSALWCYEPIVWPERARAQGRAERMAEGARRRRDRFPSRQDAHENFAAKPPFSTLDPEALRGYIDGAFAEAPDGSVTLSCPRDVEADIYLRALDDDRFARLPEVACPTVVAAGGRVDAIGAGIATQLVEALPRARLRVFDDLSHFGPLEHPDRVAAAIVADIVADVE